MKLVRGQSLDRVIAASSTVPERLALLPHGLAVVEALAYAHSQGILHRDLKPANILVGDFGETVVIDWGLAKDLRAVADDDTAPQLGMALPGATHAGDVLGTPAYMPPEQALGEPVDERADVYALGAVLYHLLAGRPPHTGATVAAVLTSVVDGTVEPLADCPPDLRAIVEKAMHPRREDRYADAGALAVDLRRFQRGQLVGAHAYSATQLVRRWVRRHRTEVAVALLAVVVLGVSAIVSVRRIMHEEQRADAERQVAVANGADAEQLMTFMLGDLRDKLEPVGKLELLEVPARRAIAHYEAKRTLLAHDRRALAAARRNLGEVLVARHDTAEALATYRTAQIETAALAVADPGNLGYWRDLKIAYDELGEILVDTGDSATALAESRTALLIAQHIATAEPTPQARRDVSVSHNVVGTVLRERGSFSEALAEFGAGYALQATVAASDPDNTLWQRDLFVSELNTGSTLFALERLADSTRCLERALVRIEKLAARDPANRKWQRDYAISLDMLASVTSAGDPDRALALFRRYREVIVRLSLEDPTNSAVRRDLAVSHGKIGSLLLDRGDLAGGVAELRMGHEVAAALAAADPSSSLLLRDVWEFHLTLGKAHAAARAWTEARSEYKAALAIAETVARREPGVAAREAEVADTRAKLAEVARR